MLGLAFVVLVSPFLAQSSPTCSNNAVQGASDPGECLLQPSVASNIQGHHDSIIAEENAEDDGEFGDEEVEEEMLEEGAGPDVDAVWDPEDDAEHAEDEAASLEQIGADSKWQKGFDGRCYNWFGNGMDWKQLKAHGIAEHKTAGVWGTFLNHSWYPNTNVCSWDTTAGLGLPNMEISYYCAGIINGKVGPCKSTKILGKNGGGIRVDCVNGLCADPTNIKHDWSQVKKGVTCYRAKLVAPILHLKSPKGNPQRSKWDPTCKVMCESIPECTGFTMRTIRRTPQCRFFGADQPATTSAAGYEAWKKKCGTARRCCNPLNGCCNHPHYTTYFITRK